MTIQSTMTANTAAMKTILYFEDDTQIANLFTEYLKQMGYGVEHLVDMPVSLDSLKAYCADVELAAIILDVRLPGKNGFEILEELQSSPDFANVPVIFTSGLADEETILKAYQAGAADYLVKPIRLKEFEAKLNQILEKHDSVKQAKAQVQMAQKMAFKAMSDNSDLGVILQYNEKFMQADSVEAIVQLMLEGAQYFSLSSSVLMINPELHHFCSTGNPNHLEQKLLETLRHKDRIFSWENRTVFNYKMFSFLARNMPIEDEVRYGELKDLICLLLNGAEASLQSLLTRKSEQAQKNKINATASTISAMVLSMESQKTVLSKRFEDIILNMEGKIASDLIQFNLLENEENILIEHIHEAMHDAGEIFEASIINEKQQQSLLSDLLASIR